MTPGDVVDNQKKEAVVSNSSRQPLGRTLQAAEALIEKDFKVFPCRRGDKRPATANGFKDATTDPDQVRRWFGNDQGLNLAVACGPQPNRINLLAVDIDPRHGGDWAWDALLNGHSVPPGPTHSTRSGGTHLFFDAPLDLRNTSGRLGPGIDTRGDGGYVVVPPSQVHDAETGEIGLYTTDAAHALWRVPVPRSPDWLNDLLADQAVYVSPLRSSDEFSLDLGESSPADMVRERWVWAAELDHDGWVRVRGRGGDEYWTRPGKNPREGHSAVLHDDGPLVVFTTERPPGGRLTRDGVGSSFSPWDYLVAYRFDGDTREAARYVRGRAAQMRERPAQATMIGSPPPAAGTGGSPATNVDATPASLNLPAAFWTQRPQLVHILGAARSAGCSPDALLIHALARTATFIHPCFKLPGVEQGLIGKHQTLDFLGCVVAETSGGKTLAAGVGELLIPAPDPPSDGSDPSIDFEQKVGSGEGIAEFFLVPEMAYDEDGKLKPTGRRIVGKQALFMSVDEGTGFTSQAGRKGTTIIATLASAWSGESLGQLNANVDTRRLVRGGRVRICAVINMQDSNGYKLYADDLESVGFTGRLLFASAHDPSAPPPVGDWPGPLRWLVRPGSLSNEYFTYDVEIVAEIRSVRHAVLTKKVAINHRQSQYLLLRCKVAAIVATWDGRLHVTTDDWRIATEIVGSSANVLEHLDSVHNSQTFQREVTVVTHRHDVEDAAEQVYLNKRAVSWKPKLVERLRKGPASWRKLRDIARSNERDMLRAVLHEMVDDGLIGWDSKEYRWKG